MPRPPSSKPGSLGAYLRRRRKVRGLSVAQLAEKVGKSRSYLTLIENGIRDVGEDLAKALARALDDRPDLYTAWARVEAAGGRASDWETATLEPLARKELWCPGDAPRALDVDVSVAKASAVFHQRGRLPRASAGLALVPLVSEGTKLQTTPRGDNVEYVRLDPGLLPQGERLVKPFAWRLTEGGVGHAPDILEPGDTVIISQDPGEIVENALYAVRGRKGAILLSRIQVKTDVLLLMGAGGTVLDALHVPKGSQDSLLVGKVVIVIRPWRYAVMRPGAKW